MTTTTTAPTDLESRKLQIYLLSHGWYPIDGEWAHTLYGRCSPAKAQATQLKNDCASMVYLFDNLDKVSPDPSGVLGSCFLALALKSIDRETIGDAVANVIQDPKFIAIIEELRKLWPTIAGQGDGV